LLVTAAELGRSARNVAVDEACNGGASRVSLAPGVMVGGAIGLLSGLTGTGGGIFLSPVLLFTGWARTRRTSGVSAVFILANSIAGLAGTTVTFGALPASLPLWIVAVLVGGVIGTQLGSRWLPVAVLRCLLAAVLVIAGLKLIFAKFDEAAICRSELVLLINGDSVIISEFDIVFRLKLAQRLYAHARWKTDFSTPA